MEISFLTDAAMTLATNPKRAFFSACNLVQISRIRLAPPARNGHTEKEAEWEEEIQGRAREEMWGEGGRVSGGGNKDCQTKKEAVRVGSVKW